MAMTTASAVGSPGSINTQAAQTVAARKMRPSPGRFSPFQNRTAGQTRDVARMKKQGVRPGGAGATQHGRGGGPQTMTGFGGQVPGQYQTPGRPDVGGGWQSGGGFPQTGWHSQFPQMPPQQQWGSPQFNYMSGYAPSAQTGPLPPWMRGGSAGGQMLTGGPAPSGGQAAYQQFTGQQTPGRPGGMPMGGMPSYGTPQYGNSAYPAIQQRIAEQRMMNNMPWQLRNMYQFNQGTGALGYNPSQMSGPGQMFQGYGTNWGYSPQGWGDKNQPWSGGWDKYSQGTGGGTSSGQQVSPFGTGFYPQGHPLNDWRRQKFGW